ncbi:MAG: S9 family peptidase [Rickettsiaceae bacterium]|nr:S9 family peptidase [Rickettsiaceae bacterium]
MQNLVEKILFFLCLSSSCIYAQNNINYPYTKSDCLTKEYIDTTLFDCFDWLKDLNNEEVLDWVKKQNVITNKYINNKTDKFSNETYIKILGFVESGYTFQKDNLEFRMKYTDENTSPSLFLVDKKDNEKIIVNPVNISFKDKISITNFSVSADRNYLAFSFNRNGSDWNEIKIKPLNKKKFLDDHLLGITFSSIEWKGDGFFYIKSEQNSYLSNYSNFKLYYHKLGTEQTQDSLYFFNKHNVFGTIQCYVTPSEDFLIIKEKNYKTNLYNFYYINYNEPYPLLKTLFKDIEYDLEIIGSNDSSLIAFTFHESNSGILVKIDPNNPYKWEKIVNEINDAILMNTVLLKDTILCHYTYNTTEIVVAYDYTGKPLHKIELFKNMYADGFNAELGDEKTLFKIYNPVTPSISYAINNKTLQVESLDTVNVIYDYDRLKFEKKIVKTDDDVEIIIDMYYSDSLQNHQKPLIIYAYGGFGISTRPNFNPAIVKFIMNGGIYVVAHIRGGGYKGKEWHKEGAGINKINSINDIIKVSEFLIDSNYTNDNLLALRGGSHGGLVVAAAAIKRPDLFKAVIPEMGVYDMLDFENYTVGNLHRYEFGSVNNKVEFNNLLSYSPYQNIKEGVNYPNMLIFTAINDERVPPFQSFKFAAALQNNPGQENLILLRTLKKAGHYGSDSYNGIVSDEAEIFSFLKKLLVDK